MQKNHSNTIEIKVTRKAFRGKRENAIKLLMKDHMEVQKKFKDFERVKEKNDDSKTKRALVRTACDELSIHMTVEEEIFYPRAAEVLETEDLIAKAKAEHASAKQLIKELEGMKEADDLYDAKFTALGEYVNHHIDKEENEMFFQLKKTDLDLFKLGDEIQARRDEIKNAKAKRHRSDSKKH